jgi:hypothetical protein
MKKPSKRTAPRNRTPRSGTGELRSEYDFSGGVRGKYVGRVAEGTNLVLLDPDVAAEFRSDRAVNRVLREYLRKKPKRP